METLHPLHVNVAVVNCRHEERPCKVPPAMRPASILVFQAPPRLGGFPSEDCSHLA